MMAMQVQPPRFRSTFKSLRKASKPQKRLSVSLSKTYYELIHRTASNASVTPSQVVVAAVIHAALTRREDWLPNPGGLARRLRLEGVSLAKIALELNRQRSRTQRGTRWRADTVLRLLQRARPRIVRTE